uniref:Putative nucleosome assembly protein nap-1 n=1 Tax=Culex tarsalis TaxID=7177 RepID=A0A1Q3FTJ6_CULTA
MSTEPPPPPPPPSQSIRLQRSQSLLRQISNLDFKINQMKRIASLPVAQRAKVAALRQNQMRLIEQQAEFHRQVHDLEVQFQAKFREPNEKRRQIVTGSYALKPEDLPEGWTAGMGDDAADQSRGVPEFWLTVFKMTQVLQVMIQEKDEEVLRRLVDVRAVVRSEPEAGFDLLFEFEPNEFFCDRILKKSYLMRCCPTEDKMFTFDGFEIYDTVGQEIQWKEGADLTTKMVIDEEGERREMMVNSFFSFFNPKKLYEKTDPELSAQFLEMDFEIGHYIKERVIPRAVSFFLGENDDDVDDFLDSLDEEAVCGVYSMDEERDTQVADLKEEA